MASPYDVNQTAGRKLSYSFKVHKSAGHHLSEANLAYGKLGNSPSIRNTLMALSPSNEPAATMQYVSSFYFSTEDHEL
jgi:hypothetical protein